MTAVVLPAANEADVAESFADGLPCGLGVRYAGTMDDVLAAALPDAADAQGLVEVEREDQPDMRTRSSVGRRTPSAMWSGRTRFGPGYSWDARCAEPTGGRNGDRRRRRIPAPQAIGSPPAAARRPATPAGGRPTSSTRWTPAGPPPTTSRSRCSTSSPLVGHARRENPACGGSEVLPKGEVSPARAGPPGEKQQARHQRGSLVLCVQWRPRPAAPRPAAATRVPVSGEAVRGGGHTRSSTG